MPNQCSDMVDNALRVGEPVNDIPHIRRDPAKLRNAHLRRQIGSPLPVYGAKVIEARYHKGVNKGRTSSWREGAGYHPELPKLVVTAAAKEIRSFIKSF